jgi:DNA mismatch endonuclease (patch repair protein)
VIFVDVFSKEKRSKIMASIRSKNTRPELTLRRALWATGLRYRIHYPIFGKPDIAFVKQRTAIFIDGCFWHKCYVCFRAPKSNKAYWNLKFKRNSERAEQVNLTLRKEGWKVLRFWEHDISKNNEKIVRKIRNVIRSR